MLAAVDPNANTTNYENLGGYLANLAAPTAIRTTKPNVRQPLARPTDQIPGAKTKMPTSSARPGKGTNQRMLYTRVQTVFDERFGPVDAAPIEEGDIVFVHRGDGSVTRGHDTARTSRVASLAQLNRVLSSHGGDKSAEGELFMSAQHNPAGDQDYDKKSTSDFAAHRWKNCKFLANWVPDGILASKEREGTNFESNPGAALNIAVGGPTLVRNSDVGSPQHIDDGARTLEKVFVGLFATENSDDPENKFFSYLYKTFTTRQLLLSSHLEEFQNVVQVWRIGSVLDTRSGNLTYRCLTMNIVIEEWATELNSKINTEFGNKIGAKFRINRSAAKNVE
jgi:hypothetical protein|tara:strand:- start:191 stop:1201 length:1011 start_codon:yes stop_codon:yes gene_type:complete